MNCEINRDGSIKDGVSLDAGVGEGEFGLDLCLRKSRRGCRLD